MRSFTSALVGAAVATIVVSGSIAIAAIPDSTTKVITGCYKKTNGELRVIDKAAKGACNVKTEVELGWNQQGVKGDPGIGLPGPKGDPGASFDKCLAFPRPGIELSGCDLTGVSYKDQNMEGTNLHNALLIEANLSDTILSYADLAGANLESANMTGANLGHTNMTGASLLNANLTGANLYNNDLTGADLTGASFSYVDFSYRDFTNTNL